MSRYDARYDRIRTIVGFVMLGNFIVPFAYALYKYFT